MAIGSQTDQLSLLSAGFTIGRRNGYSQPPFRTECTVDQWWTVYLSDIFHILEVIIHTPSFHRSLASQYLLCGNDDPFYNISHLQAHVLPTLNVATHLLHTDKLKSIAKLFIEYKMDSTFTHILKGSVSTGEIAIEKIYSKQLTVFNHEATGILLEKLTVKGNGEC